MESDDLAPQVTRKRSRSPSILPNSTASVPGTLTTDQTVNRPAKRARIRKEVPEYDAPPEEHVRSRMARSNPLSRKVLKQDAKRVRRAATRKVKAALAARGMEIDDEGNGGLEFTFLA
jgi:nuclear GTP-binding protein